MYRSAILSAVIGMAFLLASPAHAQLYKWVDSSGVTRFTDTPPPAGQTFESRTTQEALVVEIYTTDWCHWCKKAKAFFAARHVVVHEYDVEKDPAAERRRMALVGRKGVPVVVIGGQAPIMGFSEEAYAAGIAAWQAEHPPH